MPVPLEITDGIPQILKMTLVLGIRWKHFGWENCWLVYDYHLSFYDIFQNMHLSERYHQDILGSSGVNELKNKNACIYLLMQLCESTRHFYRVSVL